MFDIDDDMAILTEARMDVHRRRLPPVFDVEGTLDPRVTDWLEQGIRTGRFNNLILTGNVGTGKTWTLWRLDRELITRGHRGVTIVSGADFRRLCLPPADFARLDQLAAADMVALDDLGAVRLGDWDRDNLFHLIDRRYGRRLPTLATANGSLLEVLDERAASRLAADATVIKLTGADRRRAAS